MKRGPRKEGNFFYLLAGLLILLIVAPIAAESPGLGMELIQLASTAVVVIGIWSLVGARKMFLVGGALAAIGVLTSGLSIATDLEEFRIGSLVVVLLFCVLLSIATALRVFGSGAVDLNRIIGAICLYLLLGLAWAVMYIFVDIGSEGAFRGLSQSTEEARLSEFAYYSFVTLTTLGYGDITPSNPLARALTYFEALLGQFYIAILVGSLVGLHIAHRMGGSESNR